MEEKTNRKHIVSMTDREKLSLTGVTEVYSFDEDVIELDTTRGYVEIKGEGLHIIKMNIDEGDLVIEGLVTGIIYSDSSSQAKKRGALMSKLFR